MKKTMSKATIDEGLTALVAKRAEWFERYTEECRAAGIPEYRIADKALEDLPVRLVPSDLLARRYVETTVKSEFVKQLKEKTR